MPQQKAGAGVAPPTPVPPNMTANDPTHAGCVKSGVPNNREAAILRYLCECNGKTTFGDLVTGVSKSRTEVKRLVDRLRNRGLVVVEAGHEAVIVELHSQYAAKLGTAGSREGYDPGSDIIPDEETVRGCECRYENRDYQDGISLELDDVYELISSQRRRLFIFALADLGRDYDGDDEQFIPVGDIAELIAEATPNDDTNRKAVYITLIQLHLSKLDDAGVITYYERAKKIRPEPGVYQLESILLSIESKVGDLGPRSRGSE